MIKFLKKTHLEIVIIILIGFVPLLWFKGGEVILGHDSGLVISPLTHFFDRLYLWTNRFGLGHDQTYALSGFIIHGLEALVFAIVNQLQLMQKIIFIFWFMLPGLTMYALGKYLEKKFKLEYIAILSSIFFMFNHFLLQGWFIAERTKFSLYAAMPLFLLILLRWFDKKNSTFFSAILISVLFFFLNGNASFPLFGGVIVVFIVYLIVFLYPIIIHSRVKSFVSLLLLSFLFSSILNLYWLIPLYNFVKNSYAQTVAQVGGVSGVLTWVNYISRDSSILNLIRLQGIPEWYQNPDHAYANLFLQNPIMLLIGFMIPVIVFLPLFFFTKFKEKYLLIYFLFLSVISIIFVAGSHPPFGAFYIFMIKFVPGFIAFRTPFYKFAPALWMAYSVLLGISISFLLQRYIKSNAISAISIFLIIIGFILYSYPFLDGSFFNYIKNKRTMKTNVPNYIFEFRDWVDKSNLQDKILALPFSNRSFKVDAYTWDYWSLSPVTSLLTSASIINRNGMNEDELQIFDQLDLLMRRSDPGWKKLANLLDIKFILVRNDFVANSEGSNTFPLKSYLGALQDKDIQLNRKFGMWDLYEIKSIKKQTETKLIKLDGPKSKIGILATIPDFDTRNTIYSNVENDISEKKLQSLVSKEYLVPSCIFCNLEYAPLNRDLYRPLITKGSVFYPIAEKQDQKKLASLFGVDRAKHHLYKSLEFLLAFDKVVIEDIDLSPVPQILDEYDKNMLAFKRELGLIMQKNENSNDLLLEFENVIRVQEELINDNSSKLTDKILLGRLAKSFNLMRDIKALVMNNIWRTEDEINKRFLVTIDSSDNYNIYIRTNYQENLFSTLNYRIDDVVGEKKFSEKAGWLNVGSTFLDKGLHRIELTIPTVNIYDGDKNKEIKSSKNGGCFSSQTFTAEPGEEYKISFNHIRIKGNKKFYFKINSSGEKPNLLDKTDSAINSQGQWDTYETIYKTVNIPEDKFYFSICDAPDLSEKYSSAIKITDINVRQITTPDLVIERIVGDKMIPYLYPDFIDPTKFKYDTSSVGVVVLPTSYNLNWVVDKSVAKFTANGYANGWIVDKNSSKIIDYLPQRNVFIGFIISGVSLFMAIIYLIYAIFKNKY